MCIIENRHTVFNYEKFFFFSRINIRIESSRDERSQRTNGWRRNGDSSAPSQQICPSCVFVCAAVLLLLLRRAKFFPSLTPFHSTRVFSPTPRFLVSLFPFASVPLISLLYGTRGWPWVPVDIDIYMCLSSTYITVVCCRERIPPSGPAIALGRRWLATGVVALDSKQ